MLTITAVCVSASMIQEVKRIIKESEIMKYAPRENPRSSIIR